ncbi:hypothetical protein KA005_38940 [bacterium]|nr:hypothetical protein [bacterium]
MPDQSRSSLSMLIHGEGAAISAALINGIKYNAEVLPYKDWQQSFVDGLNQMNSEDGLQVASFQDRFAEVSHESSGVQEAIVNNPAYKNLVNKVRGLSVPRRFEYERYFSDNSSHETAEKVLGGYQSDGSYHNWTDDEFNKLSETNRILADPSEHLGKRTIYEGHHGRGISKTSFDDMGKMYDPDNVRIMSPKGHLQDGHGGNWKNTSSEPYSDITDRADEIRTEERAHYSRESNLDEIVGITIGVAAGSIGAILKYRELSKHPLPWNRKKAIAIAGAFLSGAATGVVPYLVLQEISNPIRDLLQTGIADVFTDGNYLLQDTFLDNIADASGDFFIIMSAIAVRSLIQGGIQANQIGFTGAARNFGSTIARTSVEQGAFWALQLVLDSITPIPDPVLGPTITIIRVSYSVVKIALTVQHKKRISSRKLDCLHDAAYAVVIGK